MADLNGNGAVAALELLGAGDLGLGGGDQPELFADADDAPSSLVPAKGKSGPQGGRPKGARNRSTEEMVRYLQSRYQSPLIGFAETWSRSAEDLARELFLTRETTHLAPGQTALETIPSYTADGTFRGTRYVVWDLDRAFAIQQAARAASMPYWHKKQPQALEIEQKPRGVLVVALGATQAAGDDQALPLPPQNEIQRNQDVSEAEIVKSDDEQSDGLANALSYKDDLQNDH